MNYSGSRGKSWAKNAFENVMRKKSRKHVDRIHYGNWWCFWNVIGWNRMNENRLKRISFFFVDFFSMLFSFLPKNKFQKLNSNIPKLIRIQISPIRCRNAMERKHIFLISKQNLALIEIISIYQFEFSVKIENRKSTTKRRQIPKPMEKSKSDRKVFHLKWV